MTEVTVYPNGSIRERPNEKPRYDLIPIGPLTDLAHLYRTGAEKYSERNWEKGQPCSRYQESAMRHMFQMFSGDTTEDHASACVFNVFAITYTVKQVVEGNLPLELCDTDWSKELLRKHKNDLTS